MPDLKADSYLVLNYDQDSGQTDAFNPDTLPDYRGMFTIVRYRDATRPAYNGDRLVAALQYGTRETPEWVTLLHNQGYQTLTGSLNQYLTRFNGYLTEDITNATTTFGLTTLEGLGAYSGRTAVSTADVTTSNTSQATTPGYLDYYLQIDGEIMRVSDLNPAANTVTVTRGVQGTTAVSHTAGTAVTRFAGSTAVYTSSGVLTTTMAGTKYVPLFAIDGVTGTTDIKGTTVTLDPTTEVALEAPAITLGADSSDVTTVNGPLRPAYRFSAVSAPAVTSITKQAAAGSTGTTAGAAGITCTDIAGVVAITPKGTGITTGAQCRVYFANPKASSTNYAVILSPGANAWGQQVYSGRAADYFTINFGVAGVADTAYNVHYLIVDLA